MNSDHIESWRGYLIEQMHEVVLVGWTKKRQSLDRAAGC